MYASLVTLLNPFHHSKVHGANMRPIWGIKNPDGPHFGPMKFTIWVVILCPNVVWFPNATTLKWQWGGLLGSGSQWNNAGLNTLRPRKNGHYLPDDISKCLFLNENVWISIKISLTFVLKGQINNIAALVRIMAWCWPGNQPLPEPTMVNLLIHMSLGLNELTGQLWDYWELFA